MRGFVPAALALVLLGWIGAPALGAQEPSGAAPAAPASGRVEFDLQLSEEEGGGRVAGSADLLESPAEGKIVLSGAVEIKYQDVVVHADRIELDQETEDLLASGNVVFDQGPQRLTGSDLELNLESKTGRLRNARGSVGTDYFFAGREVLKTGDDTYRNLQGEFSSCPAENPAWSFRARRADVRVDHYARVRGATFRARKLPLVYLPYVLWPVRSDRTSGFLVPKPGYSQRRGAALGLAYYWAMGRSYDTTFHLDLFAGGAPQGSLGTGNYLGFGNQFRYRPSEGSQGLFEGYAVRDPERDEVRWRVRYEHESRNLPLGLRAVIRYENASDFDYFQDYERRGDRHARRQLYSTAYLSGNWGAHSLNVNLDQRETFLSQDATIDLRQLPEIDYKMRSTRLGRSPFYLQLRSALHYLDVDRGVELNESYARGDLYPQLTLPIRTVPWLSFSLTAGGRFTWYGDSLFTADERSQLPAGSSAFRGESLSRFVPTADVEFVGPSFSKVFGGGKRYAKWKHVVEPRIVYSFLDEDLEQERVPLFDEVDNVFGTNVARFSLFNRLLAKPADEKSGGAFEVLSFEVSQDYSYDEDRPLQTSSTGETRQDGPLRALLRYQPNRRMSLRTEVLYSTQFGEISSTSVSAAFPLGKNNNLSLLWTNRRDPERSLTQTDQVRIATQFFIVPRRVQLQAQVNYDIERSLIQLQRYFLRWKGSCFDIDLEFGNYRNGERVDREYRFSVSLKNVGSFLDISGGESETF